MKLQMFFKTNDVAYDAIREVVASKREIERIERDLEKWIEYGECLTVEYDTVKKTMVVVPV